MYSELITQKFLSKVEKTKDCWIWQGCRSKNYGRFSFDGRHLLAHRVSYELFVDKIPEGLTIDHICRNPPCVNPEHLRVMTQGENVLLGNSPTSINARKTHCKNGHEFSSDNVYNIGTGERRCKKCIRKYQKKRYRLIKEGLIDAKK